MDAPAHGVAGLRWLATRMRRPRRWCRISRGRSGRRGGRRHGRRSRARQHAQIEFPPGRDPVALLEEQALSRVPELVPIRYGRMLASPFAFYRGGALIMAADLAQTPNSGLRAQLCGDTHLSNFGVFGSPERHAGVRHQRLRRDGARPVGVGREAAGGELRDRRTRERLLREGAAGGRARHGALLPRGDAGLRRDAQPRALVLASVGREGVRGVLGAASIPNG